MRLNAIGIICADVQATLGFYHLLGVDFPDFDPGQGHYEAELGGGIRLMLDSQEVVASFTEGFTPPSGNDQVLLAVEFEQSEGVDAMFNRLREAGYMTEREPFDAFWGQRYATVKDPEGNGVDLYAAT